jgi:hypothetical protein
MTCSIPLVITLLRIFQGYVRADFWNACKKKKNSKNGRESLLSEGGMTSNKPGAGITRNLTKQQEFEWLERKILENVTNTI